jgi:hypothetical protein
MNLKSVLEVIDHKFTTGDDWGFKTFSDSSHITFKDQNDQPCGHCIYDNDTNEVVYLGAEVPGQPLAFQWIHSEYKNFYCKELGEDWNIAWDDVTYTNVLTEELMLEYIENIINLDYTNLPVIDFKEYFSTNQTNEAIMKQYTVKLDVRYTFDVEADSIEDALEKATRFQQTMKSSWGDVPEVSWMDTEVVKEIVEHDLLS